MDRCYDRLRRAGGWIIERLTTGVELSRRCTTKSNFIKGAPPLWLLFLERRAISIGARHPPAGDAG